MKLLLVVFFAGLLGTTTAPSPDTTTTPSPETTTTPLPGTTTTQLPETTTTPLPETTTTPLPETTTTPLPETTTTPLPETTTTPLPGTTTTPLPGCFNPPGNNVFASIVVNTLETARPLFLTGIPDIGIPTLDPFGPVPPVNFNIDTAGLRMDGIVSETLVKNFAQFIICSVNVTLGFAPKLAFEFRLDNFHMDGLYEVDGLIASLFPVFGDGKFRLDTYETGFSGSAKIKYNILTDHAKIKDLTFDVFFKTLEMEMDCINGCGDMSNLINEVISDIGPAVFEAVWNVLQPLLSGILESGLNEYLKNISISDIIPHNKLELFDLGNANDFVDIIMGSVNDAIVSADLDPVELPDKSINTGLGDTDLYQGEVVGLSKMHRSGTCTLDKVASWVFLYANLAVENLEVHYQANVTSGSTTSLATVGGTVEKVEVYMVAREDIFGLVTDIDQFVITEFGNMDINIDGLGLLGFMLEPLTEAVMNLVRENIVNLLENNVKDLLQDVLGETQWPAV